MELILVRHALPVTHVVADGGADPELDGPGHEQAARLAGWLADHEAEGPIHAVYASPMRRARETAAPLAAALGRDIRVDDGLAEWDRDNPEYIPVEQLRAARDERWFAMINMEWDMDPDAFQARVVDAMERIIAAHRGQRVAVVCHGGVINFYASAVIGLPRPTMFFYPEYTSITRVMAASSGERSLRSLNDTAHLRIPGPRP